MSKFNLIAVSLILLALPTLAAAGVGNVAGRGPDGTPRVIKGNLGHVDGVGQLDRAMLRASARSVLNELLVSDFAGNGNEEMLATDVATDEDGTVHVRFTQQLNGLPVAGARMMLHADADGRVFGANGEFVRGDKWPLTPALDADTAFGLALGKKLNQGRRVSEPTLTYVLGADGKGYLAWQLEFAHRNEEGPQRDLIFADAETGQLVARHPQIYYARNLETRDCNRKSRNCRLVSNSPNEIDTGDLAIDSAHNYAIATYNYYSNNHGRDSIDDAGMTLISRVHYKRNYNNAFWDGAQMTYGDGDGVTFAPLSQDADVVAHELTHGVTERTSGLIYQNESGALNEAWSDIFGALVDRQEGATGADIWLLGEDIYTPNQSGDALRDMAYPSRFGDYDYYPTRYTGTADNGGVHSNSGIANLAFQLLVDGGVHPAGATSVVVPGIGFEAAADIFYAANVSCLTPSSNFAAARYCTADAHGGIHSAAVHAAWDAVGVTNSPPPPPAPAIDLEDDVALGGQNGDLGAVQQYTLDVAAGRTVTCTTSCNNGDADLYLRFGSEADPNPSSSNNECESVSSTSNESCTTGVTSEADTLFAAVHAYSAYSDLAITCTSADGGGGSCDLAGAPCSDNCCNGCTGGKPSRRVCR